MDATLAPEQAGAAPRLSFKGRYSNVGLDLGSSLIKLIQLRQEQGQVFLHQYGIYDLPGETITAGRITNGVVLADRLSRIFKQGRFHRDRVNLCIGNQAIILRQMQLPKMAPREIPEALRFQAEKEIMIPVEEAVIDYIELGERYVDGKAVIELAVVAVPREVVNDHLRVITEAGLVPEVIEIEPLALQRFFPLVTAAPEGAGEEMQIILDLGGESSSLVVLNRGRFNFARTLSIGVNHFCRRIAEEGAIEFDAALHLLFGSDPFAVAGVQEIADELVAQLRRSIDFFLYNVASASNKFESIHLCGGGASIDRLPSFLGFELKVEPKLIRPFSFIQSDRRFVQKDLEREGHLLNVAAGLALRGWQR